MEIVCLNLYEYELEPETYIKKPSVINTFVILVFWIQQRKVEPWGFVASQHISVNEFQVSG